MNLKYYTSSFATRLFLGFWAFCLSTNGTHAQIPLGSSGTNTNDFSNDSLGKKTNTHEWENEDAFIYFRKNNSVLKHFPDSSIHRIHRRPFSEPWHRDLGNLGSPSLNLQFAPKNSLGLSLGYHSFDVYRINIDSINYFNTTKPYTDFSYKLGSKLEQTAQIFHTQNIKPYWNVALNYRKINSQGYYFTQRNNHDNFFLTTNYASPSQHYKLNAAITYNKAQHDENGGILSDTFLSNAQYADRKTIPVQFYYAGYSTTRSPVSNMQRDFTLLLDHAYTWGKRDTSYSKDSTQYSTSLTPRFGISHHLEIGSQRYQYKDLKPDSLRYANFFSKKFATGDSVYMRQEWVYIDNRILLNGFIGKSSSPFSFSAGLGNRIDQFSTQYILGKQGDNILSNYLIGDLRKEALQPKQWNFAAHFQMYLTGAAAGNLLLHTALGKDLGKNWGSFIIGLVQQLNNAPYNYTIYQNQYWLRNNSFDKESNTQIFAQIDNATYKCGIGARSYLLSNYLYGDASQNPKQYSGTFSVSQLWIHKTFQVGPILLDNELMYQKSTHSAPVNIPEWMGRHQLSVESSVFKHQLKIATGVEVRYHSDYYANGYSALFNQFYYQNSYRVSNTPATSLFFNFKIKRFRSYVMLDQMQQIFGKNQIISQGYAAQNAMLRFGFNWVMVN
ncbi:MAG: hypothetical protein QM530_05825 [Phycisphaerales bacterium]|nr:hypothetical protein [Phycisphaerales bacterium]